MTAYTIPVVLGDNTLTVNCWHTPGRAGTMYRSNGDPGDPPEPEEIEIECIKIGQEDVTELLATLWVEKRGTITRDIRYVPVWQEIEQKALEAIYDSNS